MQRMQTTESALAICRRLRSKVLRPRHPANIDPGEYLMYPPQRLVFRICVGMLGRLADFNGKTNR